MMRAALLLAASAVTTAGFVHNEVSASSGHLTTTLAETSAPAGSCSSMPKLCTGLVTIDARRTHLTYLCPEPTSFGPSTIYVTVTMTTTVTPTVTTGASRHRPTPSLPTVSAPVSDGLDEPTTTITVHSTQTVHVTKTVQKATSSGYAAPKSASVGTTSSSSNEPSVPGQKSTSSVEPTTTVKIRSTVTFVQTIIVSPSPEPTGFPTLTLTIGNGTTGGIFYTRSSASSTYIATGCPTATYEMSARDVEDYVDTVYSTARVTLDGRGERVTPTEAYPGATTKALGSHGGARRFGIAGIALFLCLMVAIVLV